MTGYLSLFEGEAVREAIEDAIIDAFLLTEIDREELWSEEAGPYDEWRPVPGVVVTLYSDGSLVVGVNNEANFWPELALDVCESLAGFRPWLERIAA